MATGTLAERFQTNGEFICKLLGNNVREPNTRTNVNSEIGNFLQIPIQLSPR